jgi:sugar/nucleoside kinase (ribokinase family)
MLDIDLYEQIDYLIIGHVTKDITTAGTVLGGTAAYAGLTARAMGMKVGMITSCNPDLRLDKLDGISIKIINSEYTTRFENIETQSHREQYLYERAALIDTAMMIPEGWRNAPIVHFAPVAQEVSPNLIQYFPNSFIGLSLQGWLRKWDNDGNVSPCEWYESDFVLSKANAAVLSIDDVGGNERRIDEFISSIRILAVTEGQFGSRVYWNGDLRNFGTPKINFVDSIGAGDIYASAFFIKLYHTHDPWESARFATQIASISTTRNGLQSIPTLDEIHRCQMEVIRDWH